MVLSQLRIFTVVSATSMTSPSAPNLGISIQSPRATMRLAESWIPATRPRMLSLKISIMIAVMAPSPEKIRTGDLPMSVEIISIVAASTRMILMTCKKLLMGSSLDTSNLA